MKRDLMRGGLAWALLAGLFAAGWRLLSAEVPPTNRDMVIYMLGQLSGFLGTALAFYFSTSKSSAEKSATIDRLTKADGE